MAKRLGTEGPDPVDERLAELFRAARTPRIDPFRKRRILVRLERLQRGNLPRFWLRPLVAAALFVSGSATAELGHRYVAQGQALFASAPPLESRPRLAPAVPRSPTRLSQCEPSPRAIPAHAALGDAAPPEAAPIRGEVASTRVASADDPRPVALAIQALRTESNPIRAQILLDAYLRNHPRGALAAEALALSIEAASARHDPRAAEYARRYLAQFPRGQYRELAVRAADAQH